MAGGSGGRSEEEVFSVIGLPYIEPELREDRGEIQADYAGALPKLAATSMRTPRNPTARDGKSSLRDIVEAANARGYEYLAITDHTKHATVARGLDEKRLAKQLDEIERLNASSAGFASSDRRRSTSWRTANSI